MGALCANINLLKRRFIINLLRNDFNLSARIKLLDSLRLIRSVVIKPPYTSAIVIYLLRLSLTYSL